MVKCAICGGDVEFEHAPRKLLVQSGVTLGTAQWKILDTLLKRPGGVHESVLWDVLYADDPDGGPESHTIKEFLKRLRARLEPWGWTITKRHSSNAEAPIRLGQLA